MNVIGLDIGTSHIKAVSLNNDKGFEKSLPYFVVPAKGIAGKLLSESKDDLEEAAGQLKHLLLENSFVETKVVALLPDHKVFIKVITMPFIDGKDFDNAIKWEAEQHLPQPLSEVYLNHTIVSAPETSKSAMDGVLGKLGKKTNPIEDTMDVLLVAAPKNLVDRYLTFLNKAGLEPVGLEPAALAFVRAAVNHDASVPTLVVNIGYGSINLYLTVNNNLRFVRSVQISIANALKILVQEFDISEIQANEYLFTYGLKRDQLGGKIGDALDPLMKMIISELKKTIDFVETRKGLMGDDYGNKVRRIILTGGGALIPDLMLYLVQELSLEIDFPQPWDTSKITEAKVKSKLEQMAPILAGAVGAAMKIK